MVDDDDDTETNDEEETRDDREVDKTQAGHKICPNGENEEQKERGKQRDEIRNRERHFLLYTHCFSTGEALPWID